MIIHIYTPTLTTIYIIYNCIKVTHVVILLFITAKKEEKNKK